MAVLQTLYMTHSIIRGTSYKLLIFIVYNLTVYNVNNCTSRLLTSE